MAELEILHSRPIAPTRRVSLGMRNLPIDPAPGAGGLLLAAIVAHNAPKIEPELREDLVSVMETLAAGHGVVQPRVRHRFQSDRVGLALSPQRLMAVNGQLAFDFEDTLGRPVQLALGAVYAAGSLPVETRTPIFEALTSALVWARPVDAAFISAITGGESASLVDLRAWNDPLAWAMETLEISSDETPSKRVVQRRFRAMLRDAHPDHGGQDGAAAARIAELTEARRILLNS